MEDEVMNLSWFESGHYCLLPLTVHFQIWTLAKSFLYILDMYNLVFDIAFQAHEALEHDLN